MLVVGEMVQGNHANSSSRSGGPVLLLVTLYWKAAHLSYQLSQEIFSGVISGNLPPCSHSRHPLWTLVGWRALSGMCKGECVHKTD